MNDTFYVSGELQIILKDQNGNVKSDVTVPNLIVASGKALIAQRLAGPASVPSHMALGSSNVSPASGDLSLNSEVARVALTSSTVSGNVITYSATFAAGVGTGVLQEAGIFNAGSAGTMLNRTTFATVSKDTLDELTINWNVTIN